MTDTVEHMSTCQTRVGLDFVTVLNSILTLELDLDLDLDLDCDNLFEVKVRQGQILGWK